MTPEKRFIVALFIIIVGMGFVIKYQAEDLKAERELKNQQYAHIRYLNEQRIIDQALHRHELFAQQQ